MTNCQIVKPRTFEFKKTLTPLPFKSACSGSRNSFREMNQGCLLGISYLSHNRNTVFGFFCLLSNNYKEFCLKRSIKLKLFESNYFTYVCLCHFQLFKMTLICLSNDVLISKIKMRHDNSWTKLGNVRHSEEYKSAIFFHLIVQV